MNKFVSGGCSFTFGHELSDDNEGKTPSQKTWAYGLKGDSQYVCTARAGSGNSGIARRVFEQVAQDPEVRCVVVMWSFLSRYDWAFPRNSQLEQTRWASLSPWDTNMFADQRHQALTGSEPQLAQQKRRSRLLADTGIQPFVDSLYRNAANEYHEIYLSWKSIIWLQHILEKKNIPYMFTLADNSLFYHEHKLHADQDGFLKKLYSEIDFTKWFSFGERMMGFNQWALLNDYPRGVTHPLDKAHQDAIMLMKQRFTEITGGK
jgi:hypothetical protein